MIFRLRDAARQSFKRRTVSVLEKEEIVSTKFLLLRLIIEKCLSCQTPLVLSFVDYEQAFDSVDRRALAKVFILIWYTRQIH